MAAFAPLSCPRGSQRTNEHRTFEDIKVSCAPRPSRRLSSVAARRASPLDSALRVDWETTLGHRQLHPDVTHMRRVSPPRVSLYSIVGCELKKAHSAPAASTSTHAVLVPLGWPEDDSQCKIGKTSRGAVYWRAPGPATFRNDCRYWPSASYSLCWGGMRGVFGAMPPASTRYCSAASSPARA